MRITAPSPTDRVDPATVDLLPASLYTTGDPHLVWQTLRAERPVCWHALPGGDGFWAVTRYPDVRRVLRDHGTFTSERGTALDLIGQPDPAAGLMMHATDPPRHRELRHPVDGLFAPSVLSGWETMVRKLTRAALTVPRAPSAWTRPPR